MHSDFDAADPEDALRLLEQLTTKFSSPRSAIELGIVYSAGSFMPLSKRLGATPIQQDAVKGIRLIERGVLIIENGANDIDYNLYSAIGDTYLTHKGTELTAEALHKGIIYKRKALERAVGVNEDAAYDLQNQLAALESRPGATRGPVAPPAPQPAYSTSESAPLSSGENAEKLAKISAYFDELSIEDKRAFIQNLDSKLQENPNPDYDALLRQCVEKYTAATNAASHQVTPPSFEDENIGHDHMQSAYQDPGAAQAEDASPAPYSEYEDDYGEEEGSHPLGKYTDRIHGFGVSSPYLVGTLLFTIGGIILPIILGTYVYHDWGFLGFGAYLFTLPPIVALWLIFVASKTPRPSERSLTGLMMLRLTFFLHLGLIAAIAAGLALRFGMDGQALFGLSIFDSPMDLVLILVGLAVVVLYVTFYYGSLFSILKGLRDNIYSNMFDPLTGLGAFNVIHNIVSVLIIVGSIAVIAVSLTGLELFTIPEELLGLFRNENMALSLIGITLIISRVGGLVCISVLRQFNSGLEYDLEEVGEMDLDPNLELVEE